MKDCNGRALNNGDIVKVISPPPFAWKNRVRPVEFGKKYYVAGVIKDLTLLLKNGEGRRLLPLDVEESAKYLEFVAESKVEKGD